MADPTPAEAEPAEPSPDDMTYVEVTKHAERILSRYKNEETTFKPWEAKVVWEYWRSFEMMGLVPGVTLLKFMQDVVIPFASSRVDSRLQRYTRYDKATGADRSKTYKIEGIPDQGPSIVYRKGNLMTKAKVTKTADLHSSKTAEDPIAQSRAKQGKKPPHSDLPERTKEKVATEPTSRSASVEQVKETKQSSKGSESTIAGKELQHVPSAPAPVRNIPIAQADDEVLNVPISSSKYVVHGSLPAPIANRVDGHPDLIKIDCYGKEEIVSMRDLISNNHLLQSTVESLNTTAASMQAIIEAQKARIDVLMHHVAGQNAKIKSLTSQLALPVKSDK
ncbi:uncharacterized protein N7482_008704 [Penicillium canariense]|uniref:Uncharacterized protein n=1 Tax=Penicillium canariense TaxID=189055 RepID=A0A9W9LIL4_9EURO|nr:uncharacterized protein N7482_008704 [Penicillium canariense]KAJ5157604.1 hypothetical protein N7482_008704 [Penicillium canariense]